MTSSPPIASTNPRAMARPRPTPLPSARWSTTRWNGWNTSSRSFGRMPGPRSMTRMSTRRRPSSRPRRRDRGAGGPAPWRTALPTRLASARSSSAPSADTVGQRLGDVDLDGAPAAPRLATAANTVSSTPVGRSSTVSADACSRLMSSRLPTRSVSRSVSSSIVRWNSSTSSGAQSMSRWRRLEIDALIDASGVRRSWDTACSSEPRSVFAAARPAALPASPCSRSRSAARRDLGGERVEHALVVRRERPRRRGPA